MFDLIGWIIFGLIAGTVARLLVPGPNPIGCLGTIALGIAGSVVGGYLGYVLFGEAGREYHPAGFIGSVIGGIIVLVLWRWLRGTSR